MKRIIKSDNCGGTSFHANTIKTTYSKLVEALKFYPEPGGDGKVNFDWNLELLIDDTSIPFTIYDWKYYRPIGEDELIQWHIGAHCKGDADLVENYLNELIFGDNLLN